MLFLDSTMLKNGTIGVDSNLFAKLIFIVGHITLQ